MALVLVLALFPFCLCAQTSTQWSAVLDRLDKLEQENRALTEQVRDLQSQLAALKGAGAAPATAPSSTPAAPGAAPAASVEEQLQLEQQRIAEQAQTKVEASQKFPIRIAGMLLFNSFLDSHQSGGTEYPTVAVASGPGHAGATLRQTILGLEFNGPQTLWGGSVHGSVYMDFFSGAAPLGLTMRLRTGSLQIDWKHRSVLVGVEKPIFNPREPSSLAQVGVSPLTGTGNLWLWVPQVRVEQDLGFGWRSGLRARVGVIETQEVSPYDTTAFAVNVEHNRPGLEGRFEFYHNFDDNRRIEIAPGFHESTTHANGFSIPSEVVSADWFMNPWRRLEFSGAFFSGQNVANLGTGGVNEGYALYRSVAWAIAGQGGWGQLTLHTWPRVDLHVFLGDQQYATRYLGTGDVCANLLYGANLYYRLAPNVILAPEISQLRSRYIGQTVLINNHYDLALAYLF